MLDAEALSFHNAKIVSLLPMHSPLQREPIINTAESNNEQLPNLPISLGAALIGSLGTAFLAWIFFDHNLSLKELLNSFIFTLTSAGALYCFLARGYTLRTYLLVFFTLIFCIGVINPFLPLLKAPRYGDYLGMYKLLESGVPHPRWLGGTAILVELFRFLSSFLKNLSPELFVPLSASISMFLANIFLVSKIKSFNLVIFSTLTPVWILFSLGHVEYYPFIAGLYLGMFILLLDKGSEEISPLILALIVAGALWLYVGFLWLALAILFVTVLFAGKRAAGVTALSALFLCFLLEISWPGGLSEYPKALLTEMNLGESKTAFKAYRGEALTDSFLFKPTYIFSLQHLRHLFYMLFYGCGPIPLILFCLHIRQRLSKDLGLKLKDSKGAFALIFGGMVFLYFGSAIPKLGPRKDIDLFFTVYIYIAVFATAYWMRLQEKIIRTKLLYLALGSAVFLSSALVLFDIPRP